jgi:hypothetical protein
MFPDGLDPGFQAPAMYEQEPLRNPWTCFRLLRLEHAPSGGSSTVAPIYAELCEYGLTNASRPAYEAASYRWEALPTEDNLDWSHIHIGTKVFPVSRRVLAALRVLRLPDRSRWLWIDQICISQETREPKWDDEKRAQLRIMGQIYKQAFHTCIWRGEGNPRETAVMRMIAAFRSFPRGARNILHSAGSLEKGASAAQRCALCSCEEAPKRTCQRRSAYGDLDTTYWL